MLKIRRMLELHATGTLSGRKIAQAVGMSPDRVSFYLRRAEAEGLTWPLPAELSDDELARRLAPPRPEREAAFEMPDFAAVHAAKRAPKGKALTLQVQHERYVDEVGVDRAYSYNRFRELYNAWEGWLEPTMRQPHPAGKRVYVDYAGVTVDIIDPASGQVHEAQVFVGALGMSNLIFCEATDTQQIRDVCASHVRMFEFFRCVPEIIVPDNMKTAVTVADRHEPKINPVYDDLTRHYGVAVIPARPAKPRDKAKVETAVGIITRNVLAPLSGRRFFSVAEFNAAARPLIDRINTRQMQLLDVSRRELFESEERPVMAPLPRERWQMCDWARYKVPPSYHIRFEKHHYSVPYRYINTIVDIRATRDTVEIFTGRKRITSHPRSYAKGGYTTTPQHMPSTHQAHAEWTAERLERWGRQIGPAVGKYIEHMLAAYAHPEQGFNAALGLTRLAKRWGDDPVDAACRRALATGCHTLKSVESILKRGLHTVPIEPDNVVTLPQHPNVRGADYFQPTLTNEEGDTAC